MSNLTVTAIDEFGGNDPTYTAKLLGYRFAIDDYSGSNVLIPLNDATSRRSPRPSRSASIGAGITFADTDIVTLLVANPKTPGKANYARWESGYASGRTVAETVRLGVTRGDIRYDIAHGFVRVGPSN